MVVDRRCWVDFYTVPGSKIEEKELKLNRKVSIQSPVSCCHLLKSTFKLGKLLLLDGL